MANKHFCHSIQGACNAIYAISIEPNAIDATCIEGDKFFVTRERVLVHADFILCFENHAKIIGCKINAARNTFQGEWLLVLLLNDLLHFSNHLQLGLLFPFHSPGEASPAAFRFLGGQSTPLAEPVSSHSTPTLRISSSVTGVLVDSQLTRACLASVRLTE